MKRICRLAGIVSKPLQRRYLAATPEEREALAPVLESESRWMLEKMARRGYRLEATVAGVYGLFTRGQAQGAVRLEEASAETTP